MVATRLPKAAAKARAAPSRSRFRGFIAHDPHPHRRRRNASRRRFAFQSRGRRPLRSNQRQRRRSAGAAAQKRFRFRSARSGCDVAGERRLHCRARIARSKKLHPVIDAHRAWPPRGRAKRIRIRRRRLSSQAFQSLHSARASRKPAAPQELAPIIAQTLLPRRHGLRKASATASTAAPANEKFTFDGKSFDFQSLQLKVGKQPFSSL